MNDFFRVSFSLILTFYFTGFLYAQQTESYRDSDKAYELGREFFSHDQFEIARNHFANYLSEEHDKRSENYINASYYYALCTMRLFHKDSEYLMENFIAVYPESIWKVPAMKNLALYNFNRRDYDDALYWYQQLDERDLKEMEREEVQFNSGFAAFQIENYEKAKLSFYDLKDKESSEYRAASAYYYGYIAYSEANYQTALKYFNVAAEDPNFENAVPYYIAQIYHFQEKYDELIEIGPALMENENVMRKQELALLIGNAYYQKEEYSNALPYLREYARGKPNLAPEEAYQVGYTFYRNGQYEDAVKYLQMASKTDDPKLAQVAIYQLGGAYLELDQKKYAQNAFQLASQSEADQEIQEDALFNYAKLAYELSYDPFHEAITAFESYLEQYPNSKRKDDAYEFLIRVFVATKNYEGVLTAMDKMQDLDANQKIQYQETAFNAAIESINAKKYEKALNDFDRVNKYNPNPKLVALSHYWTGDIHYKEQNYNKALTSYNSFLSNTSAYQTDYYNLANYNIGYCHFKLSNYDASLKAFRKYTSAVKTDKRRLNDSYLRIGDLNLVNKLYKQAIENYALALNTDDANADYALFQTAQAYGYQEDYPSKISTLNSLLSSYPQTSLAAVSKYELGDSYFLKNNLNDALASFNGVIEEYPDSPYRKKALLKKGLVEYRLGNYDEAIASNKKVVAEYGVDAESNEAIAVLKNIYLDLGRIDEYTKWLNDVPDYTVTATEVDSLTYQVAENHISEGNCDQAKSSFKKYLDQFPEGIFVLNANYYLADCAYRKNDFEEAIEGFEYVAAKPTSQFSEPSLYGAASIRYGQEEFEKALAHYVSLKDVASFESNKLEAEIGIMRCAYKLENYEQALNSIGVLKESRNLPVDILSEMEITEGRVLYIQKQYDQAATIFKRVSERENTSEGAEAQYRLAEIAFMNQNLDQSEEMLFNLIQKFPSQDKWKIKGFMLLSDIYAAREDFFQARATLQSIIDNVQDTTIVAQAKEQLLKIDEREQNLIIENDTIPAEDTLDFENEYEELIEESPEKK